CATDRKSFPGAPRRCVGKRHSDNAFLAGNEGECCLARVVLSPDSRYWGRIVGLDSSCLLLDCFGELPSMHDESFCANSAVFNVQSRFTVVIPDLSVGEEIMYKVIEPARERIVASYDAMAF